MSKEEIIKMIELIDEQLKNNQELVGAYIPTTKLLMDLREFWIDILLRDHEVFYG
jgi:hypothetical protein